MPINHRQRVEAAQAKLDKATEALAKSAGEFVGSSIPHLRAKASDAAVEAYDKARREYDAAEREAIAARAAYRARKGLVFLSRP